MRTAAHILSRWEWTSTVQRLAADRRGAGRRVGDVRRVGVRSAAGGWRVRAAELETTLETRTTELESARIQLQRLSTEDPLTAVANHEQFLEFLEREWRRARRDGLPLTLIFIDIDHFRAYNRAVRPQGRRRCAEASRPRAGRRRRPPG